MKDFEKIQEEINKFGIRNTVVSSTQPISWVHSNVDFNDDLSKFEKLEPNEQGFILAMTEASMTILGCKIPQLEDSPIRRKYYELTLGKRNEKG